MTKAPELSVVSNNPFDNVDKKNSPAATGFKWDRDIQWLAGIFAITAVAVAVIGMLVFMGELNIGLQHVGTMSRDLGSYIMFGGIAACVIELAIIGIHMYTDKPFPCIL